MDFREIWSYFRHRMGLLLLILMLSIATGVFSCKLLLSQEPVQTAVMQSVNTSAGDFDNSLNFKIFGQNDEVAYQLNFGDSFRKATITTTNVPLPTDSYVRIFDQAGNLLAGEYTETSETGSAESQLSYRFGGAPKAYTLTLMPGAVIEIHANRAWFYSNLTGKVAGYLIADVATERYVVMENGLRKEGWDVATGEAVMYVMLKEYLTQQIEQYQAEVSLEVLENKELDMANKARVLLAYYALDPADQVAYQEFINLVENGKQPEAPATPVEEVTETTTEDSTMAQFAPIEPVGEPVLIAETEAQTAEVAPMTIAAMFNSLGGGGNAETETGSEGEPETENGDTESVAAEEATMVEEDATEVEQVPETETNSAMEQTEIAESKTKSAAKTEEKSAVAKIVLWVALGVVILIGFAKFILDHYVR